MPRSTLTSHHQFTRVRDTRLHTRMLRLAAQPTLFKGRSVGPNHQYTSVFAPAQTPVWLKDSHVNLRLTKVPSSPFDLSLGTDVQRFEVVVPATAVQALADNPQDIEPRSATVVYELRSMLSFDDVRELSRHIRRHLSACGKYGVHDGSKAIPFGKLDASECLAEFGFLNGKLQGFFITCPNGQLFVSHAGANQEKLLFEFRFEAQQLRRAIELTLKNPNAPLDQLLKNLCQDDLSYHENFDMDFDSLRRFSRFLDMWLTQVQQNHKNRERAQRSTVRQLKHVTKESKLDQVDQGFPWTFEQSS